MRWKYFETIPYMLRPQVGVPGPTRPTPRGRPLGLPRMGTSCLPCECVTLTTQGIVEQPHAGVAHVFVAASYRLCAPGRQGSKLSLALCSHCLPQNPELEPQKGTHPPRRHLSPQVTDLTVPKPLLRLGLILGAVSERSTRSPMSTKRIPKLCVQWAKHAVSWRILEFSRTKRAQCGWTVTGTAT